MNTQRDFDLCLDDEQLLACRSQNETFDRILQKPGYRSVWHIAAREVREFIQPAAVWDVFPIREVRHGQLVLEGDLRIGSGSTMRAMEGADVVILGVGTIGSAIGERILHYQRSKDILVGVLMDDLSTWALDQVRRQLMTRLQAEAVRDRLYMTESFSPGEGAWPVRDRGVIFKLLDVAQVGVSLSDFMVMSPLKSLSFVMGSGTQPIGADAQMSVAPRVVG